MDYTKTLDYAKEMSLKAIVDRNSKPKSSVTTPGVNFLSIKNQNKIPYDDIMSTACSRAKRYVKLHGGTFSRHPWDIIIKTWILKAFQVTYIKDYDTGKVTCNVEIVSPSGKLQGLDIEVVTTSIVRQIRAHFTSMKQLHKKDQYDHTPLWYKNETTKKHDREVIAKYSQTTPFKIPLGGNLRTANIKTPVTFGKEFIQLVNSNGDFVTIVSQTAEYLKVCYDDGYTDSYMVTDNYATRLLFNNLERLTDENDEITPEVIKNANLPNLISALEIEAIVRRTSSGTRTRTKRVVVPTNDDGDIFDY